MKSILLIFVFIFALGCTEDNLVCTTDFKYVSLIVRGDTLTDSFTIRNNTKDTIYHNEEQFIDSQSESRDYVVLTDGYNKKLNGVVESFTYIGKIGDKVVINEIYKIGGGKCHIYKESGLEEINLYGN